MLKKLALIAALSVTGAAQAQNAAANTMYGEIGYTMLKFDTTIGSAKPGMLRGIIGYNAHPNLGLEAMLGLGIKDGSASGTVLGNPASVNAKVKHVFGVYARPNYQVTPQLNLFGRLGFAQAKAEGSLTSNGQTQSASASESGFSYGLGASYDFGNGMSGVVDYMNYLDKDGANTDGLTIGVGFKF